VPQEQELKVLPDPSLRFVARQPILDRDQNLYAYELLFRDGIDNSFQHPDANAACRSTMDSSLLMGLEMLCGDALAFINCTHESLVSEYPTLFPPDRIVVEVLETVQPDESVSRACQNLKRAGFRIALDDFAPGDTRWPLLPSVDLVKVDWKLASQEQIRGMVRNLGGMGLQLLAEKVETRQDFQAAFDMGFHYFQGYFFSRPMIMETREIPAAKLQILLLLREVSKPVLDLKEIERLIKGDASLSFRLLRYLNSPAFFFSTDIRSVKHALLILGERQVRKWISLAAAVHASDSGCTELTRMALARAHFCDNLGSHLRHSDDMFFLGLLSLMDVVLGVSLDTLLERVPVSQEVKAAMQGKPGRLSPVLHLVQALEAGEWHQCSDLCKELRLDAGLVANLYWQAVSWSREVSRV
jgi:EAL and modified HD-GYP domain-containing signal transduction protein